MFPNDSRREYGQVLSNLFNENVIKKNRAMHNILSKQKYCSIQSRNPFFHFAEQQETPTRLGEISIRRIRSSWVSLLTNRSRKNLEKSILFVEVRPFEVKHIFNIKQQMVHIH